MTGYQHALPCKAGKRPGRCNPRLEILHFYCLLFWANYRFFLAGILRNLNSKRKPVSRSKSIHYFCNQIACCLDDIAVCWHGNAISAFCLFCGSSITALIPVNYSILFVLPHFVSQSFLFYKLLCLFWLDIGEKKQTSLILRSLIFIALNI